MMVTRWSLVLISLAAGCSSSDPSAIAGSPSRGASSSPEAPRAPAVGSSSSGAPLGADAGADSGASQGCTGMPICDDFESDAPGTAPAGWNAVFYPDDAGTIAVDTTRAFRGKKSVKLTSARRDVVSFVQISKKLALPTNAFFGRMRLWLASVPSDTRHWNLIEGRGYVPGSPKRLEDFVMYQFGGWGPAIGANYLSWTVDCGNGTATVPWPTSKWMCVEWQFDGIRHEMRMWIDGKPIDDVTAINPDCGGKWYAPTFEELNLGWYNAIAETSGPREMWIDDVAVSTNRIGCGF